MRSITRITDLYLGLRVALEESKSYSKLTQMIQQKTFNSFPYYHADILEGSRYSFPTKLCCCTMRHPVHQVTVTMVLLVLVTVLLVAGMLLVLV